MGHVVDFEGSNILFQCDRDDVSDLPAFSNGHCVAACWQLDPDEIAEIVRTGKLFTCVIMGGSTPPIAIGTEKDIRKMLIDYGGTFKATEGKTNAARSSGEDSV